MCFNLSFVKFCKRWREFIIFHIAFGTFHNFFSILSLHESCPCIYFLGRYFKSWVCVYKQLKQFFHLFTIHHNASQSISCLLVIGLFNLSSASSLVVPRMIPIVYSSFFPLWFLICSFKAYSTTSASYLTHFFMFL